MFSPESRLKIPVSERSLERPENMGACLTLCRRTHLQSFRDIQGSAWPQIACERGNSSEGMANEAVRLAQQAGHLSEAADLMGEAFGKFPESSE